MIWDKFIFDFYIKSKNFIFRGDIKSIQCLIENERICCLESLIRKNRISLKRTSHREDGPPSARNMIFSLERILWAEIASHSRMRGVCGDLHRK